VVQPGDTLFSISRAHRVEPEAIVRLNGLPANGSVSPGQVLRIPEPDVLNRNEAPQTQVASAPSTESATASASARTMTDAAPSAGTDQGERQVAALSPSQVAAPAGASGASSDGADGFRWPVRGRIIAGFGKQPDGARNDGINLAVPAGTPVHAAEAGTVIYAGNELEGYGNLILVQHEDDWVSAYAHNETLKVKRGDAVKRGEVIAAVGASGAVETPQLHFELRKKSKPVDPLPHLTGA
jgi:murein DD-endopeptidase MepM/ murein hydrolase activator NlpD